MSNECFSQNLQVIASRWPSLVNVLERAASEDNRPDVDIIDGLESTLLINGVQLTSRHNREHEALQQISHIDAALPEVTLYGTALGDIQKLLLKTSNLQKLNVCILNEYIFALVLQLLDQRFWLEDARVDLFLAANESELRVPFVVTPSELVLASDSSLKIRDRLNINLDADYAMTRLSNSINDFLPRLKENDVFYLKDSQVQELFNTHTKDIYVIGAGPSLEQHYDFLKKQQVHKKALLICVDTAVFGLISAGIEPDIIVTRDHKISAHHLCSDKLSANTKLVYFPIANTALLNSFSGKRYVAMSDEAMFDSVRAKLRAASLYSYGSVLHPAVDLAVKMGAPNIYLFGADFAFSYNKTHASWADKTLGPGYSSATEYVINGYGEKVPTLRNLLTYLIGLERYIRLHPAVNFYNASKAGAVISGTKYCAELTGDA